MTGFTLPHTSALDSHAELPAFILLGLACGLVAAALMRSVFLAENVASRMQAARSLPEMLHPAVAGLLPGVLRQGDALRVWPRAGRNGGRGPFLTSAA